jgi:hypothetical protein
VYEQELRDLDRGLIAQRRALRRGRSPARWRAPRLYEEIEQWDRAVEMMRRLIR